jgi:hypothetical protein
MYTLLSLDFLQERHTSGYVVFTRNYMQGRCNHLYVGRRAFVCHWLHKSIDLAECNDTVTPVTTVYCVKVLIPSNFNIVSTLSPCMFVLPLPMIRLL